MNNPSHMFGRFRLRSTAPNLIEENYAKWMLECANVTARLIDKQPYQFEDYPGTKLILIPSLREHMKNRELFDDFHMNMQRMGDLAIRLNCDYGYEKPTDITERPQKMRNSCDIMATIGSVVLRETRPDIEHKLVFGGARGTRDDRWYHHFWVEAHDEHGKPYIYDNSGVNVLGGNYRERFPVLESDGFVNGKILWQRGKFACGDGANY